MDSNLKARRGRQSAATRRIGDLSDLIKMTPVYVDEIHSKLKTLNFQKRK